MRAPMRTGEWARLRSNHDELPKLRCAFRRLEIKSKAIRIPVKGSRPECEGIAARIIKKLFATDSTCIKARQSMLEKRAFGLVSRDGSFPVSRELNSVIQARVRSRLANDQPSLFWAMPATTFANQISLPEPGADRPWHWAG